MRGTEPGVASYSCDATGHTFESPISHVSAISPSYFGTKPVEICKNEIGLFFSFGLADVMTPNILSRMAWGSTRLHVKHLDSLIPLLSES